jgi:hypothetical protein
VAAGLGLLNDNPVPLDAVAAQVEQAAVPLDRSTGHVCGYA